MTPSRTGVWFIVMLAAITMPAAESVTDDNSSKHPREGAPIPVRAGDEPAPVIAVKEPVAPVITWDLSRLEAVRERISTGDASLAVALARLRLDAEKVIQGPMVAVTDKAADALAASGDPHDYVSCSTYHWPDEKDPHAPWIWKDGTSNQANIERYDQPRLRRMAARVTDGVLAWWFTGERRYADVAVQQLRVWFIADATKMNPHLNYGQFIPNTNDNKGHKSGIIDLRDFPAMLSAVALLERHDVLGLADRTALRNWFRSYLHWLTSSDLGQSEAKSTNNHGIFYDQQVIAYASYIGDAERVREVIDHFAHHRIAAQIQPDGSMPRELGRADAATYATFTITAMVQVMVMARSCGTDVWRWTSTDGRSLNGALQWFIPFLKGKAWAWSGTFRPQKAAEAIIMAAAVTGDAGLLSLAHSLATDKAARSNLLFPLPAATP